MTASSSGPGVIIPSEVAAKAKRVRLPEKQSVFRSGDPCTAFLLVLEGSVRVQLMAAGGRQVTLYRVEPGSTCILTTSCLFSHQRYPAEAITDSPVTALSLPAAEFEAALASSSAFRRFVFDGFARRLAEVIERFEEHNFIAIDARLAAAIVAMEPERLSDITHQALADELGTAREVVSRHLKRFEQSGLVRIGRGRLEVLDEPGLRRIAGRSLGD